MKDVVIIMLCIVVFPIVIVTSSHTAPPSKVVKTIQQEMVSNTDSAIVVVKFTRAFLWSKFEEQPITRVKVQILINTTMRQCQNTNTVYTKNGKELRYEYWNDNNTEIEYCNGRITAYTVYTGEEEGITWLR